MNLRRKLEGIAIAKMQLDMECACGGYAPQKFKKFEIKEGKKRLINAPNITEVPEVVDGAPEVLPDVGRPMKKKRGFES